MSQKKQQSTLPDFKMIYLIFRDNDNDLYFFGSRRIQKKSPVDRKKVSAALNEYNYNLSCI
jgi:hypothetical protein